VNILPVDNVDKSVYKLFNKILPVDNFVEFYIIYVYFSIINIFMYNIIEIFFNKFIFIMYNLSNI
jgi:hypothetical protein